MFRTPQHRIGTPRTVAESTGGRARRRVAVACLGLSAAVLAAACGTSGETSSEESAASSQPTGAAVAAVTREHAQTVAEFLEQRGITATPVSGEAAGIAAEVVLPEGWEQVESADIVEVPGLMGPTPDASVAAVGVEWDNEAFTPQAVLRVFTLSEAPTPDEVLARAAGQLENLPLFEYGPESYDDVSGNPAYGITGAYLSADTGYIGASHTTVLVTDTADPYLVELTIAWLVDDMASVGPSVREINQSLVVADR